MNQNNPSDMYEVRQDGPRDSIFVWHPFDTYGYPFFGNKISHVRAMRSPTIHPLPTEEYISGHHDTKSTLRKPRNYQRTTTSDYDDCHETKEIRNRCVMNNGLEKCDNEISAHNTCLLKHGYNTPNA